MSEETENGTTSLKTKWFEISGKKTAEIISIVLLCLFAVMAYAFYGHEQSTKTHQDAVRDVLKELVVGIRENNCLTTFKEEAREAKAEFCKRVSR